MAQTTQRTSDNRRGLLLVGIACAAILLATYVGVPWLNRTEAQTTAATESQPVAMTGEIEKISLAAQTERLAIRDEQNMLDDGIECRFVDDTGEAFCVRFIAKIKERRASGYYD